MDNRAAVWASGLASVLASDLASDLASVLAFGSASGLAFGFASGLAFGSAVEAAFGQEVRTCSFAAAAAAAAADHHQSMAVTEGPAVTGKVQNRTSEVPVAWKVHTPAEVADILVHTAASAVVDTDYIAVVAAFAAFAVVVNTADAAEVDRTRFA